MARRGRARAKLSALRTLSPRTVTGSFWHQGPVNRPLLSFASPPVGDGRYHRSDAAGAWYASSKEGAAWIEFFRHTTSTELSPLEVKRRVGRVEVDRLDVLDLKDPDVLSALGIEEDDLIADDLALCQDIAEAAAALGFMAILAPSAAMMGEKTLVVFPAGVKHVKEVHSRVRVAPKSIRRVLRQARVPGPARIAISQWARR